MFYNSSHVLGYKLICRLINNGDRLEEAVMLVTHLRFVLYRQVEFKLGRQLVLRVQSVRKVHSSDATVRVDLEDNQAGQ